MKTKLQKNLWPTVVEYAESGNRKLRSSDWQVTVVLSVVVTPQRLHFRLRSSICQTQQPIIVRQSTVIFSIKYFAKRLSVRRNKYIFATLTAYSVCQF